MKKFLIIAGSICFAIILLAVGCNYHYAKKYPNTTSGMRFRLWEAEIEAGAKYDEKWIIGKTSKEIEEKYGIFQGTSDLRNKEGLFCNAVCSYELQEKRVGYLGTSPPINFSIYFDDKGIAVKCNVQIGGAGG